MKFRKHDDTPTSAQAADKAAERSARAAGRSAAGHGPSRGSRALVLPDMRLTRLMHTEPERCASVSEYAVASGIDTARVIEMLGTAVDADVIAFEPIGDEIFIHTAPHGRPAPGTVDVAANLWERLRANCDKAGAYRQWALLRSLETAGWVVEANQARITFSLSPMANTPTLGLAVAGLVAPLITDTSSADIARDNGPLAQLASAGARLAAICVESGALDAAVTAVRRRHLAGLPTPVLILEGPRWHPVLLRADDAAVPGRTVTREQLDSLL